MKILFLILIFVIQAQAATENVQLENSWNLFTQKLGPGFTLPEPLSQRAKISIQFEIPPSDANLLQKVFSKTIKVNEFRTEIELYFFNQNSHKYLSQQLFLYKENKLITRCTAYFVLEQKFLVPGSCAGVDGESLFGIAIYK